MDENVGRAGYPLVSCEVRLVDWKEGQYRNTDKWNPRKEILIEGKVVADGYFAEAAKENISFKEIDVLSTSRIGRYPVHRHLLIWNKTTFILIMENLFSENNNTKETWRRHGQNTQKKR